MKITIIADNLTSSLTSLIDYLTANKHLVNLCCPDVQTSKGYYHLEIAHPLFNKKVCYAQANRDIIYSALQGADALIITSTNPAEKMGKRFATKLGIATLVVQDKTKKMPKLYSTCTALDTLDNAKAVDKAIREAVAKEKQAKSNKSAEIRSKNLQKQLKAKHKEKRRRRKK